MNKLIISILFLSLFSCKQEDVQLAKADVSVMTDVQDHSPVYMFFRENEKDTVVEVNRNNTIGTTNWIFNIDKRLPLHALIPDLAKLQDKKKNGMHKKEGTINVFSYADSLHQNLAFLPFDDVRFFYDKDFSKFYIKDHAELYMSYDNFTINFKKNGKVTVDGHAIDKDELVSYIQDFSEFMSDGKPIILHLNFDKHLTFNDYIQNKLMLWKITSDKIQFSSYEFIYDETKLPECGCEL